MADLKLTMYLEPLGHPGTVLPLLKHRSEGEASRKS